MSFTTISNENIQNSGQKIACESCTQQRSGIGPDLSRDSQQIGQKVLTKHRTLPQAFWKHWDEVVLTFYKCHFQGLCYTWTKFSKSSKFEGSHIGSCKKIN